MRDRSKKFLTDTTLRDGEQSPGFAFNSDDKVNLAACLDQMGFYSIEAGIPAMGSYEKDTICRIMQMRSNTKIATWNRMNEEDIKHSFDCSPDIIHISIPVSDGMLSSLLRKDRHWLEYTLDCCVARAMDQGYEVTAGFQDASRGDIPFMIDLANHLHEMGVSSVRLADTIGILTPMRMRYLVGQFTANTQMMLGIHTHNDFGMAEAIAIEAAKAGVEFIDTTLFGIGERAGNCDCFKFIEMTDDLFDVQPAYPALKGAESAARAILFANGEGKSWLA